MNIKQQTTSTDAKDETRTGGFAQFTPDAPSFTSKSGLRDAAKGQKISKVPATTEHQLSVQQSEPSTITGANTSRANGSEVVVVDKGIDEDIENPTNPSVQSSASPPLSPSSAMATRNQASRPNFSFQRTPPGAVRIPGPGALSHVEEELTTGSSFVSRSYLPIAATIEGDDHERLREEVSKLQSQLRNAPVAQVVAGGKCKRAALVGAILAAVVLVVVLTVSVILTRPSKNAPTPAPSALTSLISDASPDNGQSLLDPSSPQSQALAWLAGNPGIDDYPDWKKIQRYALATLYYSTGGESWNDMSRWLSEDDDECTWYNRARENGMEECVDGALVNLYLYINDLQGTIPPEIAMLSTLDRLWLHDNSLSSTIPTEIGLLNELDWLALQYNPLNGSIPSEIGLMTNLNQLYLYETSLGSTIPTEIGKLTNLYELRLDENSLNGTIPTEINLLTQLDYLFLTGNAFTGSYTCPNFIGNCTISCTDLGAPACRVLLE